MSDTTELLVKHRGIIEAHRAALLEEVGRLDVALEGLRAPEPPKGATPSPLRPGVAENRRHVQGTSSRILEALADEPNLMPSELAGILRMPRQNVSVALSRLQKRGLVRRSGTGWRCAV